MVGISNYAQVRGDKNVSLIHHSICKCYCCCVEIFRRHLVMLYLHNCLMLVPFYHKVTNVAHWKVWKQPVSYIHQFRERSLKRIQKSKKRLALSIAQHTTKDGCSKWSSANKTRSTHSWTKKNTTNISSHHIKKATSTQCQSHTDLKSFVFFFLYETKKNFKFCLFNFNS